MPSRTASSAARKRRATSSRRRSFARSAALNGFRGQAKFSSWLYRIALNLCRDWIRRERRAPIAPTPEGVDIVELAAEQGPAESIEDLVARHEMSRAVAQAMATCPTSSGRPSS